MVSTKIELGNPLEADQETQVIAPCQSQGIEDESPDIYLQLAVIAQSFIPDHKTLDTYEALYKLGCDDLKLSREIDEHIASILKQSAYSPEERFNFLYQGPYIQSQKLHHHLSDEGATRIVRNLLEEQPVQRFSRRQELPSTAA